MRTRKIENTQLIDLHTFRIQISMLTRRHVFGEYPVFMRQKIGNEVVLITVIPNFDKSYFVDFVHKGCHEIQTFLIIGDSAPHNTTQYFFVCPMTHKRVRTLFIVGNKIQTRFQTNFRYLSQVRHSCKMTNEELGDLFTQKHNCYKHTSRQSDICKEIAATYYDYGQTENSIIKFRSYSTILPECRERVDGIRKALTRSTHAMRIMRKLITEEITKGNNKPEPKAKRGRKKSDPTKGPSLLHLYHRVESLKRKLLLPGGDQAKLSIQLAEAEKRYAEATAAILPKVQEFEAFIFSQSQTPVSVPADNPNR